jgi:hypothetical protein
MAGSSNEIDIMQSFQIDGCKNVKAFIDDIGLKFTPTAYNVEYLPLTWTLDSFGGDVQNAIIDPLTGEITYDAATLLSNNGNANFIVTATDDLGNKVTKNFCFKISDPSVRIPLACDGDISINRQDIVNELILFAKVTAGSVFKDIAKTLPATITGDSVYVLQNASGVGDIITLNNAPTLEKGVANGNDILKFAGGTSQQSLEYKVPSPLPVGSTFKFFALLRIDPSAIDTNACVISSTSIANTNNTASGSWQISRSNLTDAFVFRVGGTVWSNIVVGTAIGTNDVAAATQTFTSMKNGEYKLIYVEYNHPTVKVYINGVLEIQANTNTLLAGEYFKIFENRVGSSFLAGSMAEMHFAKSTMTATQALDTQAYFICKYGLDASLLEYASPFSVDLNNCYETISQFEYQKMTNGTEVIYDNKNNTYYTLGNVPTPGLGLLSTPQCGEDIPEFTSQLINDSGFITLANLPADLDAQTLSIAGNTITISGGNTITLPTPVSVVNSINFKNTTNANEFTVEIVYTNDLGVQTTVIDTTPVIIENTDKILYTGNDTIPTAIPPSGVDTAVLSNGSRYDWNGTTWVLQAIVILDGNERKLARTNIANNIAPTSTEIPIPINGDTATIRLSNGNIEHWNYTAGAWALVFTQTVASFDSTVDFSTANPNTVGTVFTPNTPANTSVLYVSTVDGSQWTYNGTTYVSAPVSADWKITGNAGTVQDTSFIGTTDNVGFSIRTNNLIRQTITNTGNVGIGTVTPKEKLHVFGATNQNLLLESTNGGVGNTNLLKARTWNGMAANTFAGFGGTDDGQTSIRASIYVPNLTNNGVFEAVSVLKATGNVGIGTIAPHSKLQVAGSEAGAITVLAATTTLNETHHKIVANNGATNITFTLPNALNFIGREYIVSRAAGSTGTITMQGSAGNTVQAVGGTFGANTTLAGHNGTGAGLNHSFTAVNVGGVGVWIRI